MRNVDQDDDVRVIYLPPARSRFPWGWLVFVVVLLVLLGVAVRRFIPMGVGTASFASAH